MRIQSLFFVLILTASASSWADADRPSDADIFPNRVETRTQVPPKARVVAAPDPRRSAAPNGSLSPENAPHVGVGVKIPIPGTGPKAQQDTDQDQESNQ